MVFHLEILLVLLKRLKLLLKLDELTKITREFGANIIATLKAEVLFLLELLLETLVTFCSCKKTR